MPLLSCQPQYCLGYFDTGVSATLDADLIPVHSISHFSPLWVRGTATTQIAAGTGLAATADHDHVMNLEVILHVQQSKFFAGVSVAAHREAPAHLVLKRILVLAGAVAQ